MDQNQFLIDGEGLNMKIYESMYLRLYYAEEYELLEMIWSPETFDMTENQYKEELLRYLEILKSIRPQKILSDTQQFNFTIVPELQEWTNEVIFEEALRLGLKTAAFIISNDLFSQASVEQMMEEPEGKKFITKYFNNKKDAIQWIAETK